LAGVRVSVFGETTVSLSSAELKVTVTVPFGGESSTKVVLLSVVPSVVLGLLLERLKVVPSLLSTVVTVILVLTL
jgi:hypothetical protein